MEGLEIRQGAQRKDNPYKVHYFDSNISKRFIAPEDHLYHFETFIGKNQIHCEFGDSIFLINSCKDSVSLIQGPTSIESLHCATVVRGYKPPNQTVSIAGTTTLPYINGCSTKQLIPPQRPGDPTIQYLKIPPYSSEQAHHIHSTTRVAYVLRGSGISVVGLNKCSFEEKLYPGKVIILEPMCPHHFETPYGDELHVIPIHIFSTVTYNEFSHPMLGGTVSVDRPPV